MGRLRLERAAMAVFWAGPPMAVAFLLFSPTPSVLRVGSESFSLELNALTSSLPWPLAEFCEFYPATLLAAVILIGCVVTRTLGLTPRPERLVWPPTFFLPTYVAGLESVAFFRYSTRCHSLTAPPNLVEVVVAGALLSGGILLFTIVLGALSARAWGHPARVRALVPPAVFAPVASTALLWWVFWRLVVP